MISAVTVSIVNFNHRRYLSDCLSALRDQTVCPEEVIVTDNASNDGSSEWLRTSAGDARLILNTRNHGYAGAHNLAFTRAQTPYVMALNCDVVLAPHFLQHAILALDANAGAGSATGKLYLGANVGGTLDSTGLFPDRYRRFHDRGHGSEDDRRYETLSAVFGPSGSAGIFRRSMLEDVAYEGEFFDVDFFAYCEDADLSWRAQRLGWTTLLVPKATAGHIHADISRARSRSREAGSRFRQLLLARNRHLCFLKNDNWSDLMKDSPWLAGYDASLQAYLAATKPKLALQWPLATARVLGRTLRKRRDLFRRARVDVRLSDWFDWERNRDIVLTESTEAGRA